VVSLQKEASVRIKEFLGQPNDRTDLALSKEALERAAVASAQRGVRSAQDRGYRFAPR
jgi:hypothetical protein